MDSITQERTFIVHMFLGGVGGRGLMQIEGA
jgi:hypothetical protein